MDEGSPERQLNIHMDPALLAGVYSNFANITFSDYEFTLTFARIDHEGTGRPERVGMAGTVGRERRRRERGGGAVRARAASAPR